MRRGVSLFALTLVACVAPEGRQATFLPDTEDGETSTTDDSDSDSDSNGDGDGDPAGDGDGDGEPTTGDGDGEPTTGDGDGEPTTGDGDDDDDPTAGDGDGEPACERYRHTYRFANDDWESIPLDQVWTGANAPPCSVSPLAITYVENWDQLLVWGADGMFYHRISGLWQPPEAIGARWGVVDGLPLEGAYNVPSIPDADDFTANISLAANSQIHLYELYENGGTVFVQTTDQADWPDPGPPTASVATRWMFSTADHDLHGMGDWWHAWMYLDDERLYHLFGFFQWESWPAAQSPLFDGAPISVSPSALEAGWGNQGQNRAYFVGP